MFEKIIVGFDGLDGGYDALALARVLSPAGGDIEVVHSFHYDFGPLGTPTDASGAVILERMTEAVKKACELDPRCKVTGVADMFPAPSLHRAAERSGAGLIVVGSCHLGAIGGLLLGDVSRATIEGAPCPVAIAPRGFGKAVRRIGSIGVGFNGSPESREALALASELANGHSLPLQVVSSIASILPLSPFLPSSAETAEIEADHCALVEHELQALIKQLDTSVSTEIVRTSAEHALADLSKDVDLLVVGSRGWGRIKRAALGSATDRLINRARSPLIVVPRPATDRASATETLAHA